VVAVMFVMVVVIVPTAQSVVAAVDAVADAVDHWEWLFSSARKLRL